MPHRKKSVKIFFGQLPYRKLCLAELILKIGIDLRTIKQKIHAAVQPQHDHDKRRQTSVHIAEVREECKVQRKKVGEQRPCDCYDKCSRNLTLKRSLPVWQIPIQYQKNKKQYYKHQEGLGTQKPSQYSRQKWCIDHKS